MASITKKKKKNSLKTIKSLGNDLLASGNDINNNLPMLLSFVSPKSEFVVESLLYIQSFFTARLSQLPSSSSTEPRDDPFKTWLRTHYDEFVNLLLHVLVSEQSEDTLRDTVLGTLMEFVKLLKRGRFHSSTYRSLLDAIIHSAVDIDVFLNILVSKYLEYIDVRYYTYISMEKLVKKLEASVVSANTTAMETSEVEVESDAKENLVQKMYQVLSRIPPPDNQAVNSLHKMWSCSDGSSSEKPTDNTKKHKLRSPTSFAKKMESKFTKAWISFLKLPLPLDVYEEVLASIHQTVIPHLSDPSILCDFLTKSYDIGGLVSVLALRSLFILMTQHGLEYPNFYQKLYGLLVPSVFKAKHQASFLELLDTCLKSPLVPANVAALFTVKLNRLSLSVPPSGSLVITALIYNLLQRHPSIVHQETDEIANEAYSESQPKTLSIDNFNNLESDPKKSGATESYLWEMDTLRHHYCPPVGRLVPLLQTDRTTELKIEDFSSASYDTIFGDEIRRRINTIPVRFYEEENVPTSLFDESDFPGWTFTIPQEATTEEKQSESVKES